MSKKLRRRRWNQEAVGSGTEGEGVGQLVGVPLSERAVTGAVILPWGTERVGAEAAGHSYHHYWAPGEEERWRGFGAIS